jgi:ATP-binding cassette subfamily C protein
VSGAESRAFANWAKDFALQERLSFKSSTVQNLAETIFSALPLLMSIIIFLAIANLMLKQQGVVMSTGEFIAFNSAFGSFLYTSLQLSSTIFTVLNLIPIYERAKPILQTPPEADHSSVDPGELSGAIEVANVSFFYTQDGPAILDNISITIAPGEFIAIVGPSGSGKSTLIRQLLGFEKPASGAIYYDGKNLADLDLRTVRRQFGVVLQNGQLLSGDIFTNIVGSSSLTHEDAWEAVKLCGLEEDIKAMPMGLFTMISEGSSTLSGGQRQRILIARAIVHRPRILLFDEATSALDNRTQSVISKSLEQLKATRIVIAHRLSTIINADRILVIHEGKIVQQGKYEELLKAEGPFKKLAWRQIA